MRVGVVLLLILAAVWAGRLWSRSQSRLQRAADVPTPMAPAQEEKAAMAADPSSENASLPKTDEEWRKVLTPEQYRVTRQKGTEIAFTGEYYKTDKQGTYRCICCGAPLFSSETKFDAHCGWPSFWKPLEMANVKTLDDASHGMRRIEVQCRNCGAHLGHVFDDGPQPTGERYCINSAALKLDEAKPAGVKEDPAAKTGKTSP
jgi:peptide-methionine (R)-S-oxide reductase